MILDNWAMEIINTGLKFGGKQIREDHYQARKAICDECPNQSLVKLVDRNKHVPGCSLCGCPTQTKPRWEEYFSWTKFRIIKAKCPDKIDRWQEVDHKFFNQIQNL